MFHSRHNHHGSRRPPRVLARRYAAALRRHLARGLSASLKPAIQLGRQAVKLGVETLDLARIHERSLVVLALPIHSPAAQRRLIRRAGMFFTAAILPMEETHGAAIEANAQLIRLNRSLSRRTQDLASSNRKLREEIAMRQTAEESLLQSERRSRGLLEQSRHMQEQLRLLSRRVLSAQEEERKRVSRELHDVIAQVLTSINLRLAVLKTDAAVNTQGLARHIARAQKLVEKSVNVVHRFAYDLRPAVLDDLGLIPALRSRLKIFSKETGIRVSLTAFVGVENLSGAKRTTLYRVAQEALANVARHAQASRVNVTIRKLPRAVKMRIRDNGKSFDVERMWRAKKSRHLGMLGMRERVEMVGGTFTAESAPGHGTTIVVQLPFDKGKEHPPCP